MNGLTAVLLALALQGPDLDLLLSRLAEEAEVFRHSAQHILAEETLRQRSVDPRRKAGLRTREIRSEYTIGVLKDAPDHPHEFRQVVSVDGRQVTAPEKARRTLSIGLQSADDRVRKRMLEDFQAYGLAGAAVDFGPLILLFSKRQIVNYHFQMAGKIRYGAGEAIVLNYRQVTGEQSLTHFQGRKTVRLPLEGQVFLGVTDGRPLRITLSAARTENGRKLVESGSVDYIMTPHGFLAPVAVLHRSTVDGQMLVENCYTYSGFRRFAAASELKFDEVPEVK